MSESEAEDKKMRGFWFLILTQFQGAFSDNTLKWLTTFLITREIINPARQNHLMTVVTVLFTLPFCLFSMAGGYLADRFSKRRVILSVKLFEIMVMSLACYGLWVQKLKVTIFCVLLMGLHSAIFGPSKYSILPELLPEKKLSWGNGILEFGTFIAIISGTVAGGLLCTHFAANPVWSGVLLAALACLGLASAAMITPLPAANPNKAFCWNPFADAWANLKWIKSDRALCLALVGYAYFFAIAALIQLVIVIYARDALDLNDPIATSYLQAATAIGIGVGCLLAGFLSGGKIETGLMPLGGLGLTACAFALGLSPGSFALTALKLSLLGFFGGFYVVPVSAMLQYRPHSDRKGGVQGVANLASWACIGFSALVFSVLSTVFKLTPPEIFTMIGLATLTATVGLLILAPETALRMVLWFVTHSLCRVTVMGRDQIPETGGALFVSNRLSMAGVLALSASTDRAIRFLMAEPSGQSVCHRFLNRILKVIQIPPGAGTTARCLCTAKEAVENGEVVCIFAEGIVLESGGVISLQAGLVQIMSGLQAPIVPVALDGLLPGAGHSGRQGILGGVPRRLPVRLRILFGPSMPSNSSAAMIRKANQELLEKAWPLRRGFMRPLPHEFIRMARRHPRRFCMADSMSGSMGFFQALLKTVFLAKRLKEPWKGQRFVGICLPPSIPAALANHAAHLCGKVPVNLNYTLSPVALQACAHKGGIQTILTSKRFLEKIGMVLPGRLLFIEDIARDPRVLEKGLAFLMAAFAPQRCLGWYVGVRHPAGLDDAATVIFSSGSTGDPKGVPLSHYNLLSNISQMEQVLDVSDVTRFLGILPLFHSFGFTVTLCLPSVCGVGVAFHPNPLDARSIGCLVLRQKVNIILATPGFLQIYLRQLPASDFAAVRQVIAGGEKLPETLAEAFEKHFGIRPQEGYGATECGPAVAVNMMNPHDPAWIQVNGKRGKVGRILPGMAARLADPDNPWSEDDKPPGTEGLLLLKGPNVMAGYLGEPEKTSAVLRNGWYASGDMATMDEDGFLQITGRLSRYSKISGEMVPHLMVEEALHAAADAKELCFVVTSLPDENRGERLVVLHRLNSEGFSNLMDKRSQWNLPNLWKPKPMDFYFVEQFPVLGTQKLDLRGIRVLAEQISAMANS